MQQGICYRKRDAHASNAAQQHEHLPPMHHAPTSSVSPVPPVPCCAMTRPKACEGKHGTRVAHVWCLQRACTHKCGGHAPNSGCSELHHVIRSMAFESTWSTVRSCTRKRVQYVCMGDCRACGNITEWHPPGDSLLLHSGFAYISECSFGCSCTHIASSPLIVSCLQGCTEKRR